MSIKYYGIYLAYAPKVNLQNEGLGRYIALFLKGAMERSDVSFVLVCPSWSQNSLKELLKSEGVLEDRYKIIAPKSKPVILRLYEFYALLSTRSNDPGKTKQLYKNKIKSKFTLAVRKATKRLVQARSLSSLLLLMIEPGFWFILVSIILSPLIVLLIIASKIYQYASSIIKRNLKKRFRFIKNSIKTVLKNPKENMFVFRLFKQMEEGEAQMLKKLIEQLTYVRAWYAPTAFWPEFNKIRAPKLICVPDVVLTDFPIGFSNVGDDRFLANFESIEETIYTGQYFVTYSKTIKWTTLVDRYSIKPENIAVIEHASNNLSPWITAVGDDAKQVEAISRSYAQILFKRAFERAPGVYVAFFENNSAKFLFYASQFRPNKNIISLLKAYHFLLRQQRITHKLILTGNPEFYEPVKELIAKYSLEKEVICLHGLKVEELAAFYKLADLVVNPSLSEGGCPFTFTEALSVGTPVVMARIPVAEETLRDPQLQEVTFFDPYDWEDMVKRIEWALEHRDELLEIQHKTYTELAKRNWTDVVNEHIDLLEQIACKESGR